MTAVRTASPGDSPGTARQAAVYVALLGNPNTGKTSLFNGLCGTRHRVGNYAGVTVEEQVGEVEFAGQPFTLIDLPGTYSLSARSLDESLTVDVLLGRRAGFPAPDVILCVLDASNLPRNLYLLSQALELDRPVVVALNMIDLARKEGVELDVEGLAGRLGVPVVVTQASRGVGLDELRRRLSEATDAAPPPVPELFPDTFCREEGELAEIASRCSSNPPLPRYLLRRLLLDRDGYLETAGPPLVTPPLLSAVRAARERLAAAGHPVPAVEALRRYAWVERLLAGCEHRSATGITRWGDRLDRVLIHRVWGTLVFAAVMLLVFQAIFAGAQPLMNALEQLVAAAGNLVAAWVPEGALQSLIVQGVIGGAGSVVTFLPQILILFLFIGALEECGYMARAAYLMDKLLSRVGLSGKSFIPLVSSFACAVPAILATRVIEDRRDRLVTILVAPLMSCSARLPVYTLFAAAFLPDRRFLGGWLGLQGLTMVAMYLLGIVAAVVVAVLLKYTILPGGTPPFVMELPDYKWPNPLSVAFRMLESGWSFVRQAGTLIVAVSVLIWAAGYFPRDPRLADSIRGRYAEEQDAIARQLQAPGALIGDPDAASQRLSLVSRQAELTRQVSREVAAANLEYSLLGRAGKWLAPLVKPLGWDWRIGCAVVASFPAREAVIGTLGVIYQLGGDQDPEAESLAASLRAATWPGEDRPVFTVPVALSIMVFFALCAQCAATLAVIRRETQSWRWPAFAFTYMTALAYLAAWATFQLGNWWLGPGT